MPPVEDQLRMAPPPPGSIVRMPCFVPSITPLRLTAMTRSYSLQRDVGERCGITDAGDVQDRVDLPERLERGGEHRLDRRLVGDVHPERNDRVAERLGRLLLPAADVGGEHLGALPHEHLGRRTAHP